VYGYWSKLNYHSLSIFLEVFEYRNKNEYGENIYQSKSSSPLEGSIPVKVWYSELDAYNWFGGEPPNLDTTGWGNFTQLVWRQSHHIGVGCACNNITGQHFIVANYDPPGNVAFRFRRNVKPPLDTDYF